MEGFSLDPAELRAAAAKLSAAASGIEEHTALRYTMDPAEIGHSGLAAQLEQFQRQLAQAVRTLRDDTHETGDRLRLTVTHYEETEAARASRISDVPPANPS